MKKIVFSLLAAAAVTTTGFAGQMAADGKSSKEFKQPVVVEVTPCFADTEFTLDLFGFYQAGDDGYYQDGFGGGVGLSYYFARYFGLGVEGAWGANGPDDVVIHRASGSFILRYPLDKVCLAPYAFVGGGALFNGDSNSEWHAGGGLEYRITPSVGVFGDGRFEWNDENNLGVFRVGARFAF